MRDFGATRQAPQGETAISIKVRVTLGCFHREHSPYAYRLIDEHLQHLNRDQSLEFQEHESGPELLVYLAITTAGLSLVKSIIDLVVALLKARSEGITKGDRPAEPVDLVVRRSIDGTRVREEIALRVGHSDAVRHADVERQLLEALKRLVDDNQPDGKTG